MKPKRTKIDRRFKIIHGYIYSLCYSNPTWLLKHNSNQIEILYPYSLIKDIYFKHIKLEI